MRIRGAGGLLVGIALYPVFNAFAVVSRGPDLVDILRGLMWFREGSSPPGDVVAFVILRDVVLLGALAAGVLGIAGMRISRFPIALAAVGIAAGSIPSVIYDPIGFENDAPPDWVFENQLWYLSGRWSALMVVGICLAIFVMAISDTAPTEAAVAVGAVGSLSPPSGPAVPPPSHWAQPTVPPKAPGPPPSHWAQSPSPGPPTGPPTTSPPPGSGPAPPS